MKNFQKLIDILGERSVVKYLIGKGYQIIEKKYITPQGEIDLIVRKDKKLIFIKIRASTNKSNDFNKEKEKEKERMKMIAQQYFLEKNRKTEKHQFDYLFLRLGNDSRKTEIKHYKNIFN